MMLILRLYFGRAIYVKSTWLQAIQVVCGAGFTQTLYAMAPVKVGGTPPIN